MTRPLVTVLHDGELPPRLERIQELAEVRTATVAELADALAGADALLAWEFRTPTIATAGPAAGKLRWIHAASAGVDRILTDDVVAGDVVVTNSRGVFEVAIAEYVLGLVLTFAKDLHGTWERQREHRWEHRDTESVAGRSALIVGVGPIGRATARLLAAVGMQVRGVGRRARTDDPDFGSVAAADDLHRLLPAADYVVLAAPLTPDTRGMIDAAALAAMKPSGRLINVGRGALVVEADLIAALGAGRLAGAALDVFENEPLEPDSPWWEVPGVVVSPHMSADADGWRDALVDVFLDNLQRWLDGRPLRNVVDKRAGHVTDAETGVPT